MKTKHEIMQEARDLIANPEHWTQGVAAKSANGTPVMPSAECATSFCMYGALIRKAVEYSAHLPLLVIALRTALHGSFISEYNDAPHRKHEDVLAMMDLTVARLKAAKR